MEANTMSGLLLNKLNNLILTIGVVCCTAPIVVFGQENLVLNGNCEEYDVCPTSSFNIDDLIWWKNYDSWGSTDYFNTCSSDPNTSIPHYFGYQLPLSGNGYIHSIVLASKKPRDFVFYTGSGNIQPRESFIGTLSRPLNKKLHVIEFYVSLSSLGYDDSLGGGDGRIATNAFDLLLLNSNAQVYNSVSPYIDLNDVIQVYKGDTAIKDTMNWVKLSTCFNPEGGETYFAIGAFRDTSEIITDILGNTLTNYYAASYYFDNFTIYECDTCCLGEFPYEDHVNVSINPGSFGAPTQLTVVLNANSSAVLSVYDSAGRLVAKNEYYEMVNNYTVEERFESGMYHWVLESSNGVFETGKFLVGKW